MTVYDNIIKIFSKIQQAGASPGLMYPGKANSMQAKALRGTSNVSYTSQNIYIPHGLISRALSGLSRGFMSVS